MHVSISTRMTFLFAMTMGMSYCQASESEIWKIEEDWEMVALQPDPISNSPQVTITMSPSTEVGDVYFQLQMNHAADAEYSEGGIRVAAVLDDAIVDETIKQTHSALAIDGDHITWTTVVAVIEDRICFAVKDGYCQHWGNFGGPEYLVKLQRREILDLSKYEPQDSLDSVDINFGSNRVSSLELMRVRLHYTDGRTVEIPVGQSD